MSVFTPSAQPISVGPAGVVLTVPIPSAYRAGRVSRLLVTHVSGSLNTFSVQASTDPTLADPNMLIAYVVNAKNLDVVAIDNHGAGYLWDGEDRENWSTDPKNIYVFIQPDVGVNNNFVVGLYLERK